jgi:hypothetical protein
LNDPAKPAAEIDPDEAMSPVGHLRHRIAWSRVTPRAWTGLFVAGDCGLQLVICQKARIQRAA